MNVSERIQRRLEVKSHLESPQVNQTLSPMEYEHYIETVRKKLQQEDAVLVAHYYTDPVIQSLAEDTGGCVADSLEMARFGHHHPASKLIVAGVKFMGETAKILSPDKQVFMPTLEATCSLDIGCPADAFNAFCDQHPERTVVVYANTSAAVKARADWVVTSSIAVDVVEHLHLKGEKFIWAPDKHLGRYVKKQTGADMLLWDAACIVHDEFKASGLKKLQHVYPEAALLVHPESPDSVVEMADMVGSTTQIINAAAELPNDTFIVATDKGIFYKLQQSMPEKTFISAPTGGEGATCKSCAHCPWMAMNQLDNLSLLLTNLENNSNEIFVDEALARKALLPLERMLSFTTEVCN